MLYFRFYACCIREQDILDSHAITTNEMKRLHHHKGLYLSRKCHCTEWMRGRRQQVRGQQRQQQVVIRMAMREASTACTEIYFIRATGTACQVNVPKCLIKWMHNVFPLQQRMPEWSHQPPTTRGNRHTEYWVNRTENVRIDERQREQKQPTSLHVEISVTTVTNEQ